MMEHRLLVGHAGAGVPSRVKVVVAKVPPTWGPEEILRAYRGGAEILDPGARALIAEHEEHQVAAARRAADVGRAQAARRAGRMPGIVVGCATLETRAQGRPAPRVTPMPGIRVGGDVPVAHARAAVPGRRVAPMPGIKIGSAAGAAAPRAHAAEPAIVSRGRMPNGVWRMPALAIGRTAR